MPDRSTLRGKRDYAILAPLVGCALRPQEHASVEVETIQLREGRWVLPTWWGRGDASAPSPSPLGRGWLGPLEGGLSAPGHLFEVAGSGRISRFTKSAMLVKRTPQTFTFALLAVAILFRHNWTSPRNVLRPNYFVFLSHVYRQKRRFL